MLDQNLYNTRIIKKRGCLFCIKKKNWIPIPEKLLIYYGDNFIINQIHKNKLQIKELYPFFAVHINGGSNSVRYEKHKKNNICKQDGIYWKKIVNNII